VPSQKPFRRLPLQQSFACNAEFVKGRKLILRRGPQRHRGHREEWGEKQIPRFAPFVSPSEAPFGAPFRAQGKQGKQGKQDDRFFWWGEWRVAERISLWHSSGKYRDAEGALGKR
jgi:hypothetical protein